MIQLGILGAFLVGALALLSGCAAFKPPPKAYQNIDQTAPAFREAVAREAARREAKGASPQKAEKAATEKVLYEFEQAEWKRRVQMIAPLQETLRAFERPTGGCWAYTITRTWTEEATTHTKVEQFDPYQPEERCWTLISLNNQTPDEAAQAAYRKAKLREWKKDRAKPAEKRNVEIQAVINDIEIGSTQNGETTYTLTSLPGSATRFRSTFTINPAQGILIRETGQLLDPSSMAGITYHEDMIATEYTLLEPQLPPFVSRIQYKFRKTGLGIVERAEEGEIVYSDYRRVKCYDDRLNVQIGPPTFIDYKSRL